LGDVAIYTERGANDEAELIRRVGDATVVLSLRAYSRFTKRVLDECPSIRMISIWGTGTDNVDLDACRERDIAVTNTPGVNANSVAEHTLALILAGARQIPAMDCGVRAAQWPSALLVQLEGKTLGIIGLGAIGRRVATLATAFECAFSRRRKPRQWTRSVAGAQPATLETLLGESDVVSMHLRLNAETNGFLDRERLALMKPSSFLINTARGALVDRDALIAVLRDGRIAGAGLDVFHDEPIGADDPLLSLPNVVLTPHNAGTTVEVIDLGLARAVENVARFVGA
jgi:phosphoglycerate dehydrogenase-like enzyme